jgi:hypothetical protein
MTPQQQSSIESITKSFVADLMGLLSAQPMLAVHTEVDAPQYRLIKFRVRLGTVCTVISLEQYIVDALKDRFNLSDNTAVRRWIGTSLANNFDANAPIMRQVRFAIFKALTHA